MEHTSENAGSRRLLWHWLVALIAAVALGVVVGVWLVTGTQQAREPSDDVLPIGRNLTIGDVTVELSGVATTVEGVEFHYSHSTSDPEMAVYPVGQPKVVNGEESLARIRKTVAEGGNRFTTSFTWRKRDADVPDTVDLHMGSFVVSRPEVSGGGQIELGEEYRSRITTDRRSVVVPLAAEFILDGRHFRATEMRLMRDPDSTEFTSFVLTIKPVDDLTNITEIAFVGDSNVSATDEAGNSYGWLGTNTLWKRSPGSRTVVKQELRFAGAPPPSGTTLNLNIEGAGEAVGPFVFEDILIHADGRQYEGR